MDQLGPISLRDQHFTWWNNTEKLTQFLKKCSCDANSIICGCQNRNSSALSPFYWEFKTLYDKITNGGGTEVYNEGLRYFNYGFRERTSELRASTSAPPHWDFDALCDEVINGWRTGVNAERPSNCNFLAGGYQRNKTNASSTIAKKKGTGGRWFSLDFPVNLILMWENARTIQPVHQSPR